MSEQYCENACDGCPINRLNPVSRNLAKRVLRTYLNSSNKPGHVDSQVFVRDSSEAFTPYVLSDEEEQATTLAFILVSNGDCHTYDHPSNLKENLDGEDF